MIETVKAPKAMGIDPPIRTSANLPGGDQNNKRCEEMYMSPVRHLACGRSAPLAHFAGDSQIASLRSQ
jgi:hypothetical protein